MCFQGREDLIYENVIKEVETYIFRVGVIGLMINMTSYKIVKKKL